MLRHDGWDDRDFLRVKPRSLFQNRLFGGFRNGDELINASEGPGNPNLFHQPAFPAGVIMNESNVMNGEHDLGAVSSPLGPCECRKVNVACDVQDVRFERTGLLDDVPTVPPAFAEVRCFDPPRFGFLRPGIGKLLERLLDAEVAEGSSFSEEPSDVLVVLIDIHFGSITDSRCFS